MYFLEGGLLMVGNLLKTDSWVGDDKRTHCNVCVQQFLPFRRRHHCRTCGEVVCGGCSSQRTIRLTEVNVECATRICTFCVIRATDASIKANEDAMRGALMNSRRLSTMSVLSISSPPEYDWRDKHQMTLLSSESALTLGSVVQLWPQPLPANETARLQVARHSTICSKEMDPTMNLLVNIVARTLECPAAFVGIMDDSYLWIKASVGLDDRVTHMPREGCICAHTLSQGTTMIVDDTSTDKHFHADDHVVGSSSMRYYAGTPVRVRGHCIGVVCALDTEPHSKTTDAMKSTLEAVANIVSEVLEQRLNRSQPTEDSSVEKELGTDSDLSFYLQRRSNRTTVDLHASLHGHNLLPDSLGMSSLGESSDRNRFNSPQAPYLPLEYADKITVALDYFHYLQSGDWVECNAGSMTRSSEAIRTDESSNQENSYTRSSMKLSGSCSDVLARLLDYEDTRLYRNFFANASRRRKLGDQTWMNDITLQSNLHSKAMENVHVLTHWRQYPDGSNVVVAISDEVLEEALSNAFLFAWFVAPCTLDDNLGSITVSCIALQLGRNQTSNREFSHDLLERLSLVTASCSIQLTDGIPASKMPSPMRHSPTRDNQKTHEGPDSFGSSDTEVLQMDLNSVRDSTAANTTSRSTWRSTCDYIPGSEISTRDESSLSTTNGAALQQIPKLNENEQMLLDLLDRTISTQEVLAQQQHEMASVIDLHGTQLERLSTALERVESLLVDKALKSATKGSV
ncbi:hypothetical protein PHYBOEH_003666 [Phytophthora boehmeriae]|uniref:FYVE-type domain-containing protein n=1 Tax=Phytophthora boehmeriae TaxID=109152 RepID=A0A8T1WQ11_9STRA|nr:hypothetical protein PHYBOEH_003666 [Phytophthora boehmeriae]